MTTELASERLTIGQVFGLCAMDGGEIEDADYLVPLYQRNYSWGAEQIDQLIDDLLDAHQASEDSYFVGNLIVKLRHDEHPRDVYEVVDGQQRLTTFFLLLAALHRADGTLPEALKGRLRYQARDKAATTLENVRRSAHDERGRLALRTGDDEGIVDGFNLVCQRLARTRMTQEANFRMFVTDRVMLVRAVLPEGTDLNRYFEVMNTRGEQLQQVDIVKARLMSKLAAEDLATFAWIWDACTDMTRYVQMTLTPGDTEKRSKIFGIDWSWLQVQDFDALRELHVPGTAEFRVASRSLSDALNDYITMPVAEAQRAEEDDSRFNSTIEFAPFLLHVLTIFSGTEGTESALDDKKLIERFEKAMQGQGDEWVRRFAVSLLWLRNLFDAHILKRQYTATNGADGDWSLLTLTRGESAGAKGAKVSARYLSTVSAIESGGAVREEGSDDPVGTQREVLLLQSMLRVTFTSPRTMKWITEILTEASITPNGQITPVRHVELLLEFARQHVRADFFDAEEEPTGFAIPRIVFTYLDYLWRDPNDARFRFVFRNSVEHFYPQNPDQEQTGATAGSNELNLLGNLALVSVTANSHFSNSLPKAKAENYADTIQAQSPKLVEMARITKAEGWGSEQINRHHGECLRKLRKDLRLDD